MGYAIFCENYIMPQCGTPITDDPDCEEGELCCACETELIHAK